MSPGDVSTLTDQARLYAGDVRDIFFRVLQPGLITIRSVPDHLPQHTELGALGTLTLQPPGSTTSVARVSAKVSDGMILLRHQATAAELAVAGEWTCELSNDSDEPLTFSTQIMGPVADVPLQSASINMGFLNTLLASATTIADIHLHVESGPPGTASFVSWSPSIASLLKGLPAYYFHVDDYTKNVAPGLDVRFHLKDLDSDPQYPRVVLLSNPLRLTAILQLAPGATIETDPGPDVDLQFFQISVDVAFDGTLYPDCQARAFLSFNGIDVSQALQSGVVDAMRSALATVPEAGRDQVRGYLDGFFYRLLRLDNGAQIRNYRSDQNTLTVDYYLPPAVQRPHVAVAAAAD